MKLNRNQSISAFSDLAIAVGLVFSLSAVVIGCGGSDDVPRERDLGGCHHSYFLTDSGLFGID